MTTKLKLSAFHIAGPYSNGGEGITRNYTAEIWHPHRHETILATVSDADPRECAKKARLKRREIAARWNQN
jgi:hypothetical protein